MPQWLLVHAGKLTETQIILSYDPPLMVDKYGFIIATPTSPIKSQQHHGTMGQQQQPDLQVSLQLWLARLCMCSLRPQCCSNNLEPPCTAAQSGHAVACRIHAGKMHDVPHAGTKPA
jgi:hypothetical protein